MAELVYLAHPYSHKNEEVEKLRLQAAAEAAYSITTNRLYVYTPVVYGQRVNDLIKMELGLPYWAAHDLVMLERCNKMYILKLPGWAESVGVAWESAFARSRGKGVVHIEVDSYVNQGTLSKLRELT